MEKIGKVFTLDDAKRRISPSLPYTLPPLTTVLDKDIEDFHKGVIDIHIHGAPDARILGRPSMLESAKKASAAGWKGVVFKDPFSMSSDKAWIIQKSIEDWCSDREFNPVNVFGGLVLNYPVGGLNIEAVKAALGGEYLEHTKCIWMPSISSAWQWSFTGREGGITILENGKLKPVVKEIVHLVASAPKKVCIGSSHLSYPEKLTLAQETKDAGVSLVINHATQELTCTSLDEAKELIQMNCWIELAEASILGVPTVLPEEIHNVDHTFNLIKELGPSRIVLASDSGQPGNNPVDALGTLIRMLLIRGFNKEDLITMTKVNPAKIIGL